MDDTGRLIEAGAHPAPVRHGATVHGTDTTVPTHAAHRKDETVHRTETVRATEPVPHATVPHAPDAPLRGMRTKDLVSELAQKGRLLARKEIELAKAEVKADLRREVRMAGGLGVAGLCALFTVQLLLVAVVLALMESGLLPGWAAALVVAAVVLAVGTAAGAWGWAKRVRQPLDTTRRSLKEDVRWAKEQIA